MDLGQVMYNTATRVDGRFHILVLNGNSFDCIYLDFAKAFYRVSHKILLI